MLPRKIAFVDIETTGLSVNYDRIIEIGILRVEDNQITKKYKQLINPDKYISPLISQITGITKESLEQAPSFSEIKDELYGILEDCIFVAHNVRFDYGFIRNEFKRCGVSYTAKHFCTVKLSRELFPTMGKYNLDSIINRFNITCINRHRAFDDANVLWEYYKILQFQIPHDRLVESINKGLKNPSIPPNLSAISFTNLPEQPGVYIFYGENGAVLYVGKSINIKDRVLSHFTSDYTSSKEMNLSQQVHTIETITTKGELGALIKESELIKKLQPLYNRQLRLTKKIVLIKSQKDSNGYLQAVIETADNITADEAQSILGLFRSKRKAQDFLISLIKPHGLCEKMLSLEKTKKSCFAYRLGTCHGACLEEEDPLFYNLRFINAFAQNKIKTWPFSSPIIITEKNEGEETTENFLIDKWCLLGTIKTDDDLINDNITQKYTFDLDTYKVIVSYLSNPKNNKKIRIISKKDMY